EHARPASAPARPCPAYEYPSPPRRDNPWASGSRPPAHWRRPPLSGPPVPDFAPRRHAGPPHHQQTRLPSLSLSLVQLAIGIAHHDMERGTTHARRPFFQTATQGRHNIVRDH